MLESDQKSPKKQHSLSIRSTPDGFSFCFSTARGYILKDLKMPTQFDFPERFEDYVQSRSWAEKEDLDVTMIDFTGHFMVLPIQIKDEEQIKTFFDFQFEHEEASQIFTVPMSDGKQMFCWEIPNSRDEYFEKLFPQLTIFSTAYLLASWTIKHAVEVQESVITAHIYGKQMHLFVADTDKLLFANAFTIKNPQEIPYYLLRCVDQLGLDPTRIKCIFCCESVSEEEVFELLGPYLNYMDMGNFSHEMDDILHINYKNLNPYANR